MKVFFSNRAYLAIITETHEKIKTETGGIFLGCYESGCWYVIETIDPGPKSIFQAAYFEYDRKYTEHLINKLARLYQTKLTLIGLWHRHPGSFDEFSRTDDGTNSDYAKLNSNGAISVLVNVDPKFRITPYHVSWPLKYTRISYEVGDNLIPERLMLLKNADNSLDCIDNYARKTHSPKKFAPKPKTDFAPLLEGVRTKFSPVPYRVNSFELTTETSEEFRSFLVDSLIDDISYFSEERGLSLSVEQNGGILSLSHKDADDIITKIYFAYVPQKKQIVFSYCDTQYLYYSGMFSKLLTDFSIADTTFKSGLMRAMGLGEIHRRGVNE